MQPDLTFLQMVTRDKFLPAVVDNIYDTNRVFKMMESRIKEASGTSLSWVTSAVRNPNVGLFGGFSLVSNQAFNPYVKLSLAVAKYYGTLSFPFDDLQMNVGNKEKLLDMAKAGMTSIRDQLTENLGLGMYSSGTATTEGLQPIIGFGAAITGSTGTYAGLDRSSSKYAFWRANSNATTYSSDDLENPTAAGYLPRVMATSFSNATHFGSPTIIITQEDVFNHYAIIAQVQNLRVTEHAKADLGFQTLGFQGATMLFDKYCPAYTMYMLNEKDWDIFVYPGANFDFVKSSNGSIWLDTIDQIAQIARIVWMGQMRLNAPRQQAVLSGLGNG